MTLRLKGYLRDNPGGAAVSGITVNLLDINTGAAPTTTAFTNLSGTSAVTDANGMWTFTMDLGTGPLRVEAQLGGANKRHRRQDEVFEYEGWFINQLDAAFRVIEDGVVHNYGSRFDTSASATRVLTISSGLALIRGNPLGWDSGTKAITGSANGAAGTTRYDFLVLRQYYNGTSQGKQDIVLVQGGSSTDPVATSTETDLTKYIQGSNIWDIPLFRAKLAFGGTVYTLDDLRAYAGSFSNGSVGSFAIGDDLTVADQLTVNGSVTNLGNTQLGNTGNDVVTLYGHIEVAGTSPSVDTSATNVIVASTQTIVTGSDTSFEVQGTSKNPPVIGTVFVITFNQARGSSNYQVQITPRSSDAAGGAYYVTSKGTAGFTIACNSVLGSTKPINLGITVT